MDSVFLHFFAESHGRKHTILECQKSQYNTLTFKNCVLFFWKICILMSKDGRFQIALAGIIYRPMCYYRYYWNWCPEKSHLESGCVVELSKMPERAYTVALNKRCLCSDFKWLYTILISPTIKCLRCGQWM